MLNKIIAGVLNWFITSLILPAMYFVYDVYRLRKENKELKKSIEDLKNAKDKKAIDIAIDNLP
jgi:hypothetical protein